MSTTLEEIFRQLVREVVREEFRALHGAVVNANVQIAPPESESSEVYVSVRRAAQIAEVHPATIRDWLRKELLHECHAGRELRVELAELHAFMRRSKKSDLDEVDLDARAREILQSPRRRAKSAKAR